MPQPRRTQPAIATRADLERCLVINEDNIDESLVEQPGYFDEAAKRAVEASAKHRDLKLEFKELLAELDQSIRRKAIDDGEKLSEAQLSNRITTLPKVKAKAREVLAAERLAETWGSLKESFQQRSYMLRELNASQQAKLFNLGVERGATSARREAGDRVRAQAEEERRNRRYRPQGGGD